MLSRSRFTVILICLCLTLSLWAESWHLPEFERLPLKQPLTILTKTPLTGNRSLLYAEIYELGGRAVPVVQLNQGKAPQWRVRARFSPALAWPTTNQRRLRYEAHSQNLLILRCFVRRGQGEWGDVALALNLSDGSQAWVGEPMMATIDQPGGPNLRRGDSLYETFLSPNWSPTIVRRRLADGKAIFSHELRGQTDESDDLILRRVDSLRLRSDGLLVLVADKLRRWQSYLLSPQDGTLKEQRNGVAGLQEKMWQ